MDPERIYVFSGCEEGKSEPCWPETFVNDGSPVDPCDECGAKPAEYIRADVARALYAAGQQDMRNGAIAILHSKRKYQNEAAKTAKLGDECQKEAANRIRSNAILEGLLAILDLEIKDAP
jgi:hypothetical protein